MTEIKRIIGNYQWSVSERGAVYRSENGNDRGVICANGSIVGGYEWHFEIVETAIALRKEWLAKSAEERDVAPKCGFDADGVPLTQLRQLQLNVGVMCDEIYKLIDDFAAAEELASRGKRAK